jgi:hypothetical protein
VVFPLRIVVITVLELPNISSLRGFVLQLLLLVDLAGLRSRSIITDLIPTLVVEEVVVVVA